MPEQTIGEIGYTRLEIITCGRARVDFWEYPERRLQMPFWRIYYPINDCGFFTHHRTERQMVPGRVYLIAPETPFSCRMTGSILDKLVFHFIIQDDFCNCRDMVFDFPVDSLIAGYAERLMAKENKGNKGGVFPHMCALAFCAAIIDLLPSESLAGARQIDPLMRTICQEIRHNISREYKNSDMAKTMNVSTSVFVRRFTAAFGMAPQQYVLEERLRQASYLLMHSNLSIEEIAERTGFCDRYYFTRAFTKFRYISPAKFRKGTTIA